MDDTFMKRLAEKKIRQEAEEWLGTVDTLYEYDIYISDCIYDNETPMIYELYLEWMLELRIDKIYSR